MATTHDVADALNPVQLVDVFILFAPYILGVMVIVMAVSLVAFGVRTVAQNSSFWGGSVGATFSNYRSSRSSRISPDEDWGDVSDGLESGAYSKKQYKQWLKDTGQA